MDQTQGREIAKDAADQARETANEAAKRVGEQVQPALDQGRAMVQDLASQASEAGRQVMDRAGKFIEDTAPQVRRVASNLYDRGAQSGEYIRQYVAQEPLASLLVAGVIGFTLGYLIRGAEKTKAILPTGPDPNSHPERTPAHSAPPAPGHPDPAAAIPPPAAS